MLMSPRLVDHDPTCADRRSDIDPSTITFEWNQTTREYPRDSAVHELFEVQAARRAGATALVTAGGALAYGELNRRANRLARYLCEHGHPGGAQGRRGLSAARHG
jgi:non-ribosomal peptide synthetase component F